MKKPYYLNILILFFMSTLLIGCGSLKKKKNRAMKVSGAPTWTTNIDKGCPAGFLCAIGEGSGQASAEAAARESVAKIFETRIEGTKVITQNSSQTGGDDGLPEDSYVGEEMNKQIKEFTDQVINGVEVKKFHPTDTGFYALAQLSKRKAKDVIKEKVVELDSELVALKKDGRRSALYKATKLLKTRNRFGQNMKVLGGSLFSTPVPLSSLRSKLAAYRAKGVVISLSVLELGLGKEIEQQILKELTDIDYKVVKKGKNHDYRVKAELSKEREHLNVKGFERYRFVFKVSAHGQNGKKLGALEFADTQSGRSWRQAYEQSLPKISQFIRDHINELNID